MNYKDLEIWQLAKETVVDIHNMSINDLPKYEHFEEGSQIRRSIKSVKSNIVEGYGRRYYKQEFVRFIIFSLASKDETIDHLETLFETNSLKNKEQYLLIHEKLDKLGRMLNRFLEAVKNNHISPK